MEIQTSGNGRAVIAVSDTLELDRRMVFHDACDVLLADGHVRQIEVDLRAVRSLRAEAVGMLLLVRDRATAAGVGLSLRLARGRALDILRAMGLNRSFSIFVDAATEQPPRLRADRYGRYIRYRIEPEGISPSALEDDLRAIMALSMAIRARRVMLDCTRHAPPPIFDLPDGPACEPATEPSTAWRVALVTAAGCAGDLLDDLLAIESLMQSRQRMAAVFQDEAEASAWLLK